MKKFLRTTITGTAGEIIPARLNTQTGEIKPYPYRLNVRIRPQGTINDDPSTVLFWQVIPAPNHALIVPRETKSRKIKPNTNNVFLKEFDTLDDARQAVEMLDNLITGVSHLHQGRKPTCKGLLFRLLRDIDEISTDAIQAYTGYSDRYAQMLAQALRVLSVAFDAEIER